MATNINDIVLRVLQEDEGDVFRDRSRRFEAESDRYRDTLDPETDSSEFETDGGIDVDDASESVFLEVLDNLGKYKELNDDMLGDLKKLAGIDRSDSIANGLTDPLKKIIEKARNNINEIVNKLEVTEAVSDKIRQKIATLKS